MRLRLHCLLSAFVLAQIVSPFLPDQGLGWIGSITAQAQQVAPPPIDPNANIPVVAIRGGSHADYSRLVFDWSRGVDYKLEQTGNRITVLFNRPARADFSTARGTTGERIRSLTQAPNPQFMEISFVVPPGTVSRSFLIGTKVVVDILDPPKTAATPPPQPASPQVNTAAAQPQPAPRQAATAQQPAAQQPATQQATTGQPAGQAAAGAPPAGNARPGASPAEVPLYQLRGTPLVEAGVTPGPAATGAPTPIAPARSQATATNAARPSAPNTPVATPAPSGSANQTAGAVGVAPPPVAAPVAIVTTAVPPPLPSSVPPSVPPPPPGNVAAPLPSGIQAATPTQPVNLIFDPGIPTSAAIYERAGHLHVLFDREVPPTTQPVIDAPGLIGAIEPFNHAAGSGFRIGLGPVLEPVVSRDGTRWIVTLRLPGENRATGLQVTPDNEFALGPRLIVKTADAATVIEIKDPAVGDTITVIPLPTPGDRIPTELNFRQVQLPATAQGIVVRPLDDQVLVRAVDSGVEIGIPGGLALSAPADIAAATPQPKAQEEASSLFDYKEWGAVNTPNKFHRERQERWIHLVDSPPEERPKSWIDLSRFYVANGRGHEANGALNVLRTIQKDVAKRPEFLAVDGAAKLLMGDARGASAALKTPLLDGDEDAALWRAGATAASGDWQNGYKEFASRLDRLDSYPSPIYDRLALIAAETAIKAGDSEMASTLLRTLEKRAGENGRHLPAVRYFQAQVARNQGDLSKAKDLLGGLVTDRNLLYRTMAKRDLIELQSSTGEISAKTTAKRLERMRFDWRGDEIEFDLNRRIANAHLANGDYVAGFDALKRMLTDYPNHPKAPEITKQLSDEFINLFAKDGAAHLKPVEALTLYNKYKELNALQGETRDMIMRALAERMVETGLLDNAGTLLEEQIRDRLTGLEKVQVGTRLAAIRLLDRKPQKAIEALDRSSVPAETPPELFAQRRLMRARALSELGKGTQAIQLLAQDATDDAKLLRVDIARREKNWPAVAQTIADIVGPPPGEGQELTAANAKLVVNRAIALSLAQDSAALTKLRQEFGPAMERTQEATAFRVLTRPEEAAGVLDAASIRSRMAETDLFRNFLEGFRRQQAPPTPPPATTAAPPQAPAPTPQTN